VRFQRTEIQSTKFLIRRNIGVQAQIDIWFYVMYTAMNIPEEPEHEWKRILSLVTKVPGVTGFVGSGRNKKPVPLSADDVKNVLQRMGEIKGEKAIAPRFLYDVGEAVKVVDGPFKSFTGTVEDVNNEKEKIKVRVEIFGRSTPVELDFLQIEKI